MNSQKLTISTILFAAVLSLVFSGVSSAQAQGPIFLTNEIPKPIATTDPNFMSFEQFMQYMFYYEQMFGKDYVTKIYKEYHNDDDDDDDDDDDRDKKKHHRDKDWWKHNSADLWKDKKKYCEGKGSWNGKKCVTDNDEDETAWEDAVCDNNPGKSKFCDRDSKDDDEDDNDDEITQDEIQDSIQAIKDEEENHQEDYDSDNNNEEPEESEEQEEEEEEEEEDDSDDDGGNEDDSGGDDSGGDEEG